MQIIAQYRNLAVRHKLTLIILFALLAALLPASIAVFTYDQIAARREMRSDLDVLIEPPPAAIEAERFTNPATTRSPHSTAAHSRPKAVPPFR
jgi:hypothetical protein